jgi:hypothetical protein
VCNVEEGDDVRVDCVTPITNEETKKKGKEKRQRFKTKQNKTSH